MGRGSLTVVQPAAPRWPRRIARRHEFSARQGCGEPRRPAGPGSAEASGRSQGVETRIRVLLVDDERSIRMVCRVNLTLAGIEVLEAENGALALELVGRERPDIVLLDVMMPDLDGWEVAERLQAAPETRDVPVAFLTARAADADRRRAFGLGAVDFIVKPFDPLTLPGRVESILRRLAAGERDALRHELLGQR